MSFSNPEQPLLPQSSRPLESPINLAQTLRLSLQIIWYLTWLWGDAPKESISSQFKSPWVEISTYCGIASFFLDVVILGLTEKSLCNEKYIHQLDDSLLRAVNITQTPTCSPKKDPKNFEYRRRVQINYPNRFYQAIRPIIAFFYFGLRAPDTFLFFDALALCSVAASSLGLYINKKYEKKVRNDNMGNTNTNDITHYEYIAKTSAVNIIVSLYSLLWTVLWPILPFTAACNFILTNSFEIYRINSDTKEKQKEKHNDTALLV